MNEAKQIDKEREFRGADAKIAVRDQQKQVIRKNKRSTEIAVWSLVALEAFRLANEHGVLEWLFTLI